MPLIWRILLAALALTAWTAPAAAAHEAPCHAVAPAGAPLDARQLAALRFDCGPITADYRGRWLWFRIDPPKDVGEYNLSVQPTRVDRVRVLVLYADGSSTVEEVRAGDYGDHWSLDNRVTFDLREGPTAVRAIYIGAYDLRFWHTLDPRLLRSNDARYSSSLSALLVGAALALLFASFVYNVFRIVAQRERVLIGHAAWAGFTFIWGLLWSQAILVVFPGLAGTWSARLGTLMAAAAITAASLLFAAAVERRYLSRRSRRLIAGFAALPTLVATGTLLELGPHTGLMITLVNVTALTPIAVVAVFAGLAVWRGSRIAREFALAWLIPMFAVIASTAAGVSLIPGVSGQMSVLIASAFQTILLSMTMTMRVADIRAERDRARRQGDEYRHLALTDAMTSLANRRGFVEAAQRLLGGREPVGMLLIDIDHFKSINDTFGHFAGDQVLVSVGAALAEACPARGIAGRLGGEEFGIAIPGLTGAPLAAQAKRVHAAIARLDFSALLGDRRVACSIGVSDSTTVASRGFDELLRAADGALYDAKRLGRNRVIVHGSPEREAAE